MPLTDNQSRDRIRDLNNAFRTTFTGGRITTTAGVEDLPLHVKMSAIIRVMTFSEFTSDNDPHGEHDFGSFELEEHKFYFKIDYYDPGLEFGSADPADPAKTTRVLTLMLATEY